MRLMSGRVVELERVVVDVGVAVEHPGVSGVRDKDVWLNKPPQRRVIPAGVVEVQPQRRLLPLAREAKLYDQKQTILTYSTGNRFFFLASFFLKTIRLHCSGTTSTKLSIARQFTSKLKSKDNTRG